MLSQCEDLSQSTEGRYATDAELDFFLEYVESYPKRLSLYQKLQTVESDIVETVHQRIMADHPHLLKNNKRDITVKWKRDTVRTLRVSAVAILLDDPTTLQERYLLWFQSVMGAFKAQKSCDITYSIMQEVVHHFLEPDESSLLIPILELNRTALGMNT
ncbi:MAG: phycobilisome protein [Cyanobacteria bacterium P01_F01_bin.150]